MRSDGRLFPPLRRLNEARSVRGSGLRDGGYLRYAFLVNDRVFGFYVMLFQCRYDSFIPLNTRLCTFWYLNHLI